MGILYFKLEKLKFITLIVATSFLFIGCGPDCPEPKCPPPKKIYIKSKCPDITLLKPLDKKDLTSHVKIPVKRANGKYYIEEKVFNTAALRSQEKSKFILKQERYIKFYENHLKKIRRTCRGS